MCRCGGFGGGSGGGGGVFPPTAPVIVPAWFRIGAFTYEDFQTDNIEFSLNAYDLPTKGVMHGVVVTPVTQFAGPGFDAITVEFGIIGDYAKFTAPLDILSAVPGATVAQVVQLFEQINHAAITDLFVTLRSVGAGLDAMTAGAFTIDALISVTP